jgi:hypothetical protein
MQLEEWHRWWKTQGRGGLKALLMQYWDPIGVKGASSARDEYDSYLGQLANVLRNGADATAVAEHLAEIQTRRMGLPSTAGQLMMAGRVIVRGTRLR